MGELIIVGIIVVSAAGYLGLRYWGQFRAKNGEASCGCGACPGGGCQGNEKQCSEPTNLNSLQPQKEV
jgi:hypothetical protein